jgi:hypothetical protein
VQEELVVQFPVVVLVAQLYLGWFLLVVVLVVVVS